MTGTTDSRDQREHAPAAPNDAPPEVAAPRPRRRPAVLAVLLQRAVLVRLAIAIVVVTTIAILNPSFLGWGTVVTAAILSVPASRARAYSLALLPYGLFWLVFSVLRALADETPVRLRTEEVTAVERWLFSGATPTIWLQERLFDPTDMRWYDYATTFVHWSYFFIPHVVAIVLWRRSPDLYRRFLLATAITLGIGLVVYFLSPAAPPWLTADRAPQQDIFRVMANVGRSINSSLYDRTYSVLGDPNPVAAMPSLHQAITFLLFLFALNGGKKWAIPAFLYALAMAFALVYTGEHYVIDVVVGSAIATYAYFFAGRWLTVIAPVFQLLERRATPVAARREARA